MKDKLLQTNEKQYGSLYKEHLFEQYKFYLESIEKVSDRRQGANNYFITVNTVLISLIGMALEGSFIQFAEWIKPFIAGLGVVICIVFWFLIRSYKQLNTGKFKVLHEIEEQLPIDLYRYEWSVLGKGKKIGTYFPFSHIEQFIPWVFGGFYVTLMVIFIFCK
ncbi:hypothetical protein KKA95_02115 [Patescibacteria group bacterium]|nr:hypothetical protein [Patescibacteria group bacterium]